MSNTSFARRAVLVSSDSPSRSAFGNVGADDALERPCFVQLVYSDDLSNLRVPGNSSGPVRRQTLRRRARGRTRPAARRGHATGAQGLHADWTPPPTCPLPRAWPHPPIARTPTTTSWAALYVLLGRKSPDVARADTEGVARAQFGKSLSLARTRQAFTPVTRAAM